MPMVAAALGAVGGPASYWAGARLGAMEFVAPLPATVALVVGWAVLAPALIRIAQRFDGVDANIAVGSAGANATRRELGRTR
jgi:hypothetical protein